LQFEQSRDDLESNLYIPASVNDLENKYGIRNGNRRLDWTSFLHSFPALLRHPQRRLSARGHYRVYTVWYGTRGTMIGLPSGHGRRLEAAVR